MLHSIGGELFEQVCRAFGLREEWYFGLQYEDNKGNICWLKKEKRVVDQNISKENCIFMFIAKFFPENVQDELIQEITQHLFFLQIKQAILTMGKTKFSLYRLSISSKFVFFLQSTIVHQKHPFY